MANKLRPEPMPSATNALMDAIGRFYENDGLAGMLGMTSVNRQIHDATQAQMAAPNVRAGVAAAVENPMTMAVGPATIRAYHGSPYSFDKFDLAKIGTGEGAQAYGHGLYFADNEAVAKSYRDILSQQSVKLPNGQVVTPQWDDPAFNAAKYFNQAGGDVDKAVALAQADKSSPLNDLHWKSDIVKVLEDWRKGGVQPNPPGSMYEVNLHADPAALLDWDKPLAQQSPGVQGALQPILDPARSAGAIAAKRLGGDPSGMEIYQGLRSPFAGKAAGIENWSDPAAISARLEQSGIPGIKYLDGGSRGSGTGTSNYVMFDPARVEILRKYGLLPAAAVGAATSAADAALVPVDHDPFGAPLMPVDHDPFGGQ